MSMSLVQRIRLASGILALSCSLAAAARSARQGKDGEPGPPPLPEILPPGQSDLASEMVKLFQRVEQNLTRIDTLLNDASAGDAPLSEVEDSGLDDLLRRAQVNCQTVISDIDQILELARRQGGSCSKCLKSGNGKPKDSPLDRPRDSSPRAGEETPEQPTPEEARKEEQPAGERPESPAESRDKGESAPGEPFDPRSGDPVPHPTDADEWGLLPPKIQEIFRSEGSSDLPVQYRDWIDAYYRRLARSKR